MDVLELSLAAVADVEAPRLVVGRVRRGCDLAVPRLSGEPRLDVVLLRSRRAEIARSDVQDAVLKLELLHELLFDREQTRVLIARPVGLAERERSEEHTSELQSPVHL